MSCLPRYAGWPSAAASATSSSPVRAKMTSPIRRIPTVETVLLEMGCTFCWANGSVTRPVVRGSADVLRQIHCAGQYVAK